MDVVRCSKGTTREPELFGKGSIDGLMAAETGDMSSIPGHMIPMLALGVPGSAPSAVLMAAIIIHGIQPGPMMMVEHPQFAYDMVAMTTLATVCILIFGLYLVRPLLYVLRVKHSVLMPIIFVMSVIGSYATAWRLFDVYAMLAVGVGAFFLRRKGYQMAPFVLGLVLGNLLDKSLRRGLVLTDGSIVPFFTRPICIAFAVVTIFTMLLYVPAFNRVVRCIADAVISPLKSFVGRRDDSCGSRCAMKCFIDAARKPMRLRCRARLRRIRDYAIYALRNTRNGERDQSLPKSAPLSARQDLWLPACIGCW